MKFYSPAAIWFAGVLVSVLTLSTSSPAQDSFDDDFDFIELELESTETAFYNEGKIPSSLEQLREMEQVFAEIADLAAPATVNIAVGEAQGSGVVVSRDGYVLTAAHVINYRPNLDATVTFSDGTKAKAITLGINRSYDSGLVKIVDDGKWPFLNIGESESLKRGQWVLSVGHPGGLKEDRGLVYRAGRIIKNDDGVITTDCTLVGGDSGGPLIDLDGFVIGIHSRIGSRLNQNFHVPIDRFSNDWDQLVDGAIVGSTRPYLGISFKPSERSTNVVETVTPNEAASKAGMKKGDVIIKMNDTSTRTRAALNAVLQKLKPKDEVNIVVLRDGNEIELKVTLGYR